MTMTLSCNDVTPRICNTDTWNFNFNGAGLNHMKSGDWKTLDAELPSADET